jgi:uncharacterized protein
MSRLALFRTAEVEVHAMRPADVLGGDPATRFGIIAEGEQGRLSAGWWTADVGSWRVSCDEWEYCHIVEGRAELAEEGRTPVLVGPGDSFVISAGFRGTWTVLEPVTKHFVILDAPA